MAEMGGRRRGPERSPSIPGRRRVASSPVVDADATTTVLPASPFGRRRRPVAMLSARNIAVTMMLMGNFALGATAADVDAEVNGPGAADGIVAYRQLRGTERRGASVGGGGGDVGERQQRALQDIEDLRAEWKTVKRMCRRGIAPEWIDCTIDRATFLGKATTTTTTTPTTTTTTAATTATAIATTTTTTTTIAPTTQAAQKIQASTTQSAAQQPQGTEPEGTDETLDLAGGSYTLRKAAIVQNSPITLNENIDVLGTTFDNKHDYEDLILDVPVRSDLRDGDLLLMWIGGSAKKVKPGGPKPSGGWTLVVARGPNDINLQCWTKPYDPSEKKIKRYIVTEGKNQFATLSAVRGVDVDDPVVAFDTLRNESKETGKVLAPAVKAAAGGAVAIAGVFDDPYGVTPVDNKFHTLASFVSLGDGFMSAMAPTKRNGMYDLVELNKGKNKRGGGNEVVGTVSLRPKPK